MLAAIRTAARSPPLASATLNWYLAVPGRRRLGAPAWTTRRPSRRAGMLALGATGTVHLGAHGEQRGDDVAVFVQSYRRHPG